MAKTPGLPSTLPQVKNRKVRALAVSCANRSPAVPELPTVAEAGVPGFELTNWYGVLAPARTPPELIGKLRANIVNALNAVQLKPRLSSDGAEIVGSSPEAFGAYIRSEIAKWAKVLKAAGIRAK